MKIMENDNLAVTALVKKGLAESGGYCPCQVQKSNDTLCMCKEFREQIADPSFEGFCRCALFRVVR